MKKKIAALLALVLVVSAFAACNEADKPDDETTGDSGAVSDSVDVSGDTSDTADTGSSVTESEAKKLGYVVVTDYFENDEKSDVSEQIQKVIDENPNHTIYFPAGVYIINQPIVTPADPLKAVSLKLDDYAIIRAGNRWKSSYAAMIRLGGKDPANDIATPGANYTLSGGCLDGKTRANGVSIESGRETAIRDMSIKNTVIGIHIMKGANGGSSDSDIYNVNIYGRGLVDSIGVLIEGADNTVSDMRIANVNIGIKVKTNGNMFRNIHPLYILNTSPYDSSCAFYDEAAGPNFYDFCYSDNFRYAYYKATGACNHYTKCFAFWYCDVGSQTVFKCGNGQFNSVITDMYAGFWKNQNSSSAFAVVEAVGGDGVIEHLNCNSSLIEGTGYEKFVKHVIG